MVVSLSIISIVFLAMGSVMILASKALPTAGSTAVHTFEAADVLQQLTSELQTATSIAAVTDKSIAFTVPDRDNDSNDEMIIYQWSGTAGDPLVRRYNGGASVNVLPHAFEFNLTYGIKSIPQPDILIESAEVEFSRRAAASVPVDYAVDINNWIGQYFLPTLPGDAVSWKVTRVLVKARSHGPTDGQTLIQLRPPQPGDVLPSNTVLEQVSMMESSLPSFYVWRTFNFSTVQGLTPGEGLCLVLQWVSSTKSAEVQADNNAPAGMLSTSDGGSNWNYDSGKSLLHYVYGTYTAPVPQPPTGVLRSVTVTLNPGQDPSSRVRTAVTALNRPEIP